MSEELRGELGPELPRLRLCTLNEDCIRGHHAWDNGPCRFPSWFDDDMNAGALRRIKWRAFWWGFWHPFADPRASRPLTKFEEWRYSKKVRHEHSVLRGSSCNRVFRGFCWQCLVRDLTGTTKRTRRRYVAQMHERANSIPPTAVRRYRRGPNGSWERAE